MWVSVETGAERFSGTDADVYFSLKGQDGDIAECKLARSLDHLDKFERGATVSVAGEHSETGGWC